MREKALGCLTARLASTQARFLASNGNRVKRPGSILALVISARVVDGLSRSVLSQKLCLPVYIINTVKGTFVGGFNVTGSLGEIQHSSIYQIHCSLSFLL